MPWVIPLIGLAVTGTTAGLEAAGTFQPSTTAASKALQTQEQQTAAADQLAADKQAWKQASPNAQAQTGGSLSGPGLDQLIQELSGSTGTIPQIQQALGVTQPGLSTNDYQVT